MNTFVIPSNEFWGNRFGAIIPATGERVIKVSRGSAQAGQNNSKPVGKRNTRWYGPAHVPMQDTYKQRGKR